eukprot:gene11942-25023_t
MLKLYTALSRNVQVRLSEAHAKLMFRSEVLVEDAIVAISLMELSMSSISVLDANSVLHSDFPDDDDSEETYLEQENKIFCSMSYSRRQLEIDVLKLKVSSEVEVQDDSQTNNQSIRPYERSNNNNSINNDNNDDDNKNIGSRSYQNILNDEIDRDKVYEEFPPVVTMTMTMTTMQTEWDKEEVADVDVDTQIKTDADVNVHPDKVSHMSTTSNNNKEDAGNDMKMVSSSSSSLFSSGASTSQGKRIDYGNNNINNSYNGNINNYNSTTTRGVAVRDTNINTSDKNSSNSSTNIDGNHHRIRFQQAIGSSPN